MKNLTPRQSALICGLSTAAIAVAMLYQANNKPVAMSSVQAQSVSTANVTEFKNQLLQVCKESDPTNARIVTRGVLANVRSSPGFRSPVISMLGNGFPIIASENRVLTNNVIWVQIQSGNYTGWVAEGFVRRLP